MNMEIEQLSSPDIEAFKAMELLKAGDKLRAIDVCHKALSQFGSNGNLFLVKARAHLELGDIGFAEDALLKLLHDEPDHPAGWTMLGEVYYRQGKSIKVEYCRRRLEYLFPVLGDYLRGSAHDGQMDASILENSPVAEVSHVPVEDLNSSDIVPLEELSKNNQPFALNDDTSGSSADADTEIFETSTFAEICVAQGKIDKALAIYRNLLRKNPDNEFYLEKVKTLQSRMDDK